MAHPLHQSLAVCRFPLAAIVLFLTPPAFAQSSPVSLARNTATIEVSPTVGTTFELPLPELKTGEYVSLGLLNDTTDIVDSNRTYQLLVDSNPVVVGTRKIDGTSHVLLQGDFGSEKKTYFFGIRPDGAVSKSSSRFSKDRTAAGKSSLLVPTSFTVSPKVYSLLLSEKAIGERLFSTKLQDAASLIKAPQSIPFFLRFHKSGERVRFKVVKELQASDSLSVILMLSSGKTQTKGFSTFRPNLEVGRMRLKVRQARALSAIASVVSGNENQRRNTIGVPKSPIQPSSMGFAPVSNSTGILPPSTLPVGSPRIVGAASEANQETGQRYYVDFSTGLDTNTGLSANDPWKHAPGDINATDSAKTTVLKPGDAVLFKGGVIYEGAVVPKFSGTEVGGKVLYKGDSWGTGKAIMDGGKLLFTAFDVSADFLRIEGFEIRNYKQGIDIESYNYTKKIAKGNHVDVVNNTIHDITGKGVQTRYVNNILLEGNEIFNTGYDTFTLQASDVIVRNNHLHHGNVDGIKGGGGGTILIENNHIHDFTSGANHGDGIQMMWYKKLIVRNNLFYNSTQNVFIAPYCPAGTCDYRVGDAYVYNNIVANPNPGASGIGGMYNGINVHPGGLGAGHVHIYNNTLINLNGGSAGVRIAARWTPPNLTKAFLSVTIKNNIFYNSLMTPSSSLAEVTNVSNNLFFNTVRPTSWYKGHLANDPASKYGNPLLRDIAAFDVGLQATSPAINAGVPIAPIDGVDFARDRNGVARPQDGAWDVGASQFATSGTNLGVQPQSTPTPTYTPEPTHTPTPTPTPTYTTTPTFTATDTPTATHTPTASPTYTATLTATPTTTATPTSPPSPIGIAPKSSSLSQHGITWYFDKEYQYGQFANGDYWVLGPVTITKITPEWDGLHNGWEVNPMPSGQQAYDIDGTSFSLEKRDRTPKLPYVSQSGESILKTHSVSSSGIAKNTRSVIHTAAILTVLGSVPENNGKYLFRPPYVGIEKPLYSINSLKTNLLPVIPKSSVITIPSIAGLSEKIQRVHMDHIKGNGSQYNRPRMNMHSYAPNNAVMYADIALRLMLNDSLSEKMPLLTNYVQVGIDNFYMFKNGQNWPPGGGEEPGHKLVMSFAAALLDNSEMKTFIKNNKTLYEDVNNGIFQLGRDNRTLFARVGQTESFYWKYMLNDPGYNLHYGDRYGLIDGGGNAVRLMDGYQQIIAGPVKGSALVGHLLPSVKEIWSDQNFYNYVDRFVSVGLWTQPDACAPPVGICQGGTNPGAACTTQTESIDLTKGYASAVVGNSACAGGGICNYNDPTTYNQNYKITYGPNPAKPGQCILDKNLTTGSTFEAFSCQPGQVCGRFPKRHGLYKNLTISPYRSNFTNGMWTNYRDAVNVSTTGN